ncbi:MAG: hypothetical protein GY913_12140 [Proteobacteria bacterium]|nr:hypothetical protein [Pseudomonadota bacterium]MCP4917666.1 hypothetical protein [Pseudomonadota bacterium]
MERWEHATIEWLWDSGAIRLDLPDSETKKLEGLHAQVVELLNVLGAEGWQVVASTSTGNWIFWTLKRRR